MYAGSPWLVLGLAIDVAQVVEELLFRHLLLRRFALAAPPLTGLLITALLFSALHDLRLDGRGGSGGLSAGSL
jgi:membrane protease YdiL (CAAX protease family)